MCEARDRREKGFMRSGAEAIACRSAARRFMYPHMYATLSVGRFTRSAAAYSGPVIGSTTSVTATSMCAG